MKPVEVRAETTAKFLALADEAERKRTHARGSRVFAIQWPQPWERSWMAGALAAMLVLGAVGGEELHQRHERAQAALATQQFEAGVRVTDQALEQTRAQLAQAGVRLGD
jgi:hypothetical protein